MKLKFDQKTVEEICKKYKVEFLGVFGSAARGDDGPDSDVDVLVRFAKDSDASLLDMVIMEEKLAEMMANKKIDLVTKDFLSPYIRDGVMQDLIGIYGTIGNHRGNL
jgi:uncharacterized protein